MSIKSSASVITTLGEHDQIQTEDPLGQVHQQMQPMMSLIIYRILVHNVNQIICSSDYNPRGT